MKTVAAILFLVLAGCNAGAVTPPLIYSTGLPDSNGVVCYYYDPAVAPGALSCVKVVP